MQNTNICFCSFTVLNELKECLIVVWSDFRWATVATTDMGRKERGVLCPFRGELAQLGPHLIQCGLTKRRLGQGLPLYQVAS